MWVQNPYIDFYLFACVKKKFINTKYMAMLAPHCAVYNIQMPFLLLSITRKFIRFSYTSEHLYLDIWLFAIFMKVRKNTPNLHTHFMTKLKKKLYCIYRYLAYYCGSMYNTSCNNNTLFVFCTIQPCTPFITTKIIWL